MTFWHQLLIELPISVICFLGIGTLLWKLRSLGYWACAIGFALFVALTYVQLALSHGTGGPDLTDRTELTSVPSRPEEE